MDRARISRAVLIVKIQHANPYYDDSYAVNSANVGPYGDAIENELIPAIEKQFRGIGAGLGAFCLRRIDRRMGVAGGAGLLSRPLQRRICRLPRPVDFHAYMTIDLYDDKNAFFLEGAHKRVPQPAMRDYLGHTLITTQDNNQPTNSRSAITVAAASSSISGRRSIGPVGDGRISAADLRQADRRDRPQRRPSTGIEHYDLEAILERNWATLGPKLAGKIHIYVGSDDTYFLNDAVYRMEDFLKSTKDPAYGGEVTYGPRAEHCWNGDPTLPNAYSRLHYNTQYLPKILEQNSEDRPPRRRPDQLALLANQNLATRNSSDCNRRKETGPSWVCDQDGFVSGHDLSHAANHQKNGWAF